jgi:protein-S-isoprenylcysteine O-methyltransferase Ste14
MRRSRAAAVRSAWFVLVGGTFGCLLPDLLDEWHVHRPLPYWTVAQAAGVLLICAGLVPVMESFVEFAKAGRSPMPLASPPHLVVSGFYRYVRNPIYVGFLAILLGEALLFGSFGLMKYTAVAWCIGAAGARWYEEPILARKFGAEYEAYRRAVPAWLPRLHPWTAERAAPATAAYGPRRSSTVSEGSTHMTRMRGAVITWLKSRGADAAESKASGDQTS